MLSAGDAALVDHLAHEIELAESAGDCITELKEIAARAFCEKVESRWDSRESVFVIQASHWSGGQHEWGSHIRMTCDAVSFKRLRLVIRTRKLRICAA